MRFWIIPLLIALGVSTDAKASSNVEPELCYMKIQAAIKAGSQTGRFELLEKHCEKYKAIYDLEFGDPSRPRLIGETAYPQALEHLPQINSETRDACWDALVESKYDKYILKENQDCVDFIKTVSPDPWAGYLHIVR